MARSLDRMIWQGGAGCPSHAAGAEAVSGRQAHHPRQRAASLAHPEAPEVLSLGFGLQEINGVGSRRGLGLGSNRGS